MMIIPFFFSTISPNTDKPQQAFLIWNLGPGAIQWKTTLKILHFVLIKEEALIYIMW